jgi:HK97 family phage prohead protease
MELERKFQARVGGGGGGLLLGDGAVVEGHASVFGQVDRGGDVVLPGAYAKGLARMEAEGRRVRMLWQHDPASPIGVWDEVREDATGLFVRGRILTELAQGREAAALVAAGAIDGLSIGYRTIRADRDGAGHRRLVEVELWEVSLVTFPMQAEARVSAKAADAPWSELALLFEGARADLAAR